MRDAELLDLLERALRAADHPEATEVSRFAHPGQLGVKVRFQDGSTCMATSYGAPTSEAKTSAR